MSDPDPLEGSVPGPPGIPFQFIDNGVNRQMNFQTQMFGIVHQMRGIYQTAFCAHYVDGVDLVDLSDPALGPVFLGSCDTSPSHIQEGWWEPSYIPGHTLVQDGHFNASFGFRGVYDVWPYHDSGLICLAGGIEGAIIFRVDQGHLNRYWMATPFGPGAGAEGIFPRIVAENGPPREGRQLILRDSNRHRLSETGFDGQYRYSMIIGLAAPTSRPTVPTGGFLQNVVPLITVGPQSDDTFIFPASMVPLYKTRLFAQMIVEEGQGDSDNFIPYNPARIAASRGTWFGVAKP